MVCEGMYIASHTYSHYFLNSLDKLTQGNEIDKSIDFLKKNLFQYDIFVLT
jgi:peptidoglycan/xylan/chitin deacetylase (PgdA/CDA1 family)